MADLNSMIAQGAQFQAPIDPFAQYGRMQQLQQGQNQNELARYTMAKAQQEDVTRNALNQAYQSNMNPTTGEINYAGVYKSLAGANAGASIPAIQKSQFEVEKEKAGLAKTNQEVFALKNKALGTGLIAALQDPSDAGLGRAFDMLDSQGIPTKDLRTQFAAIPDPAKRLEIIKSYVSAHPEGIAALNFVKPSPTQITRPDGKIIFVDNNPNSPTFKQEVLPSQAAGMTPFQAGNLKVAQGNLAVNQGRLAVEQGNANAPQYMVTDQGVVALPKRPKPGEITGSLVRGPSGEPLQKELKPIPANINTAISTNDQTLKSIDEAIRLIKANPDAVGWKGYAPNKILNETNPEGVDARAAISNIGSLKLHERSGAAVTASEFPRLAPFIPLATDDAATVVKKLTQMRNVAQGEQQNLTETYTREQGYRPSPVLKSKLASTPAGSIHDQADAILRGGK